MGPEQRSNHSGSTLPDFEKKSSSPSDLVRWVPLNRRPCDFAFQPFNLGGESTG